jgi:hypothetical protein
MGLHAKGRFGSWLRENVYGRKSIRIFFLDLLLRASQGSCPDSKAVLELGKAGKAKDFCGDRRLRLPPERNRILIDFSV